MALCHFEERSSQKLVVETRKMAAKVIQLITFDSFKCTVMQKSHISNNSSNSSNCLQQILHLSHLEKQIASEPQVLETGLPGTLVCFNNLENAFD